MAAILSVRRCRPAAPPRARSGSTASAHIAFISSGTPGRRTIVEPPAATRKPGADPRGFARTTAPSITSACFSFTSGISRPRRRKRSLRRRRIASSRTSARPSTFATASFVRSSSVGPSPPVTTRSGARESASGISARRSAQPSPTQTFRTTEIPSASSRLVRYSEFVSRRAVPSSSLPDGQDRGRARARRDRRSRRHLRARLELAGRLLPFPQLRLERPRAACSRADFTCRTFSPSRNTSGFARERSSVADLVLETRDLLFEIGENSLVLQAPPLGGAVGAEEDFLDGAAPTPARCRQRQPIQTSEEGRFL